MNQNPLSSAERERYARHLLLPDVGLAGQLRLREARVALVGAGGLGSPLALYLAAAGVGTLGLIEFDEVDRSNLQRQILYGEGDVGRPKGEAAMDRLREINPHIQVNWHNVRLEAANALDILGRYQVVADGTDNFAARYLVNDACVRLGIPNVYGSIFRFEGQVSVFWRSHGPCYRCLFPEPPPPGTVPSCAEGGVLGVLPGIIGSLQVNEVLKIILGLGETLVGRFVVFDALKMSFREVKLPRNPDCPVCGDQPTLRELIDYDVNCELEDEPVTPAKETMEVEELKEWKDRSEDFVLIDVRNPNEWDIGKIGKGEVDIPLHLLPLRFEELDPEKTTIIYCRTGIRSLNAMRFLQQKGFRDVRNLTGGIHAWSYRIDPSIPRY